MEFSCPCGQVSGFIDKPFGPRSICYCDDCQAYAYWIGSTEILDEYGGTDILPVMPSAIHLRSGEMGCVRLSPRGMLRWYAACCKTPIANLHPSPRVPFAGFLAANLRADPGPIVARVQGKFARGGSAPGASASVSPGFLIRVLGFLAQSWLRGGHKRLPFRTDLVRVLSKSERASVR